MNKIIRNEADHEEALHALESLMYHDPTDGTPEADELELLTLLIQDYESQQQYDFVTPDPIKAIHRHKELAGENRANRPADPSGGNVKVKRVKSWMNIYQNLTGIGT